MLHTAVSIILTGICSTHKTHMPFYGSHTAVDVLLWLYCCGCTAVAVLLWLYCCGCTAVASIFFALGAMCGAVYVFVCGARA